MSLQIGSYYVSKYFFLNVFVEVFINFSVEYVMEKAKFQKKPGCVQNVRMCQKMTGLCRMKNFKPQCEMMLDVIVSVPMTAAVAAEAQRAKKTRFSEISSSGIVPKYSTFKILMETSAIYPKRHLRKHLNNRSFIQCIKGNPAVSVAARAAPTAPTGQVSTVLPAGSVGT